MACRRRQRSPCRRAPPSRPYPSRHGEMRSLVALLLASIGLGSAQAQAQPATTARVVELALPRAASANEAVDLEVRTGVVLRGTQIDVTTPSGELLGTISPFAIPPG